MLILIQPPLPPTKRRKQQFSVLIGDFESSRTHHHKGYLPLHPTQRQVSRSVIRDGDTTTGADGPYRPTICLGSNPSSKHQVRSSIGRSTVHQLSLSNPVPCIAALVFKERAVTSSRTAHRLVHLVRLCVFHRFNQLLPR